MFACVLFVCCVVFAFVDDNLVEVWWAVFLFQQTVFENLFLDDLDIEKYLMMALYKQIR